VAVFVHGIGAFFYPVFPSFFKLYTDSLCSPVFPNPSAIVSRDMSDVQEPFQGWAVTPVGGYPVQLNKEGLTSPMCYPIKYPHSNSLKGIPLMSAEKKETQLQPLTGPVYCYL